MTRTSVAAVVACLALAGCSVPDAERSDGGPAREERPPWDSSVAAWAPFVARSGIAAPTTPSPGSWEDDADRKGLAVALTQRSALGPLIARWNPDRATEPWTELALDMIAKYKPSPPAASRALALVHVAMHDALVAVAQQKLAHDRLAPALKDAGIAPLAPLEARSSFPSEYTAVAGAAAGVLQRLFPGQGLEYFPRHAEDAARSRVAAGVNWPSDVQAGLAIGRAVAEQVMERARHDGAGLSPPATVPQDMCAWQPTPPSFIDVPLEPGWGEVRPWFLARGDQVRPAPPPSCDSGEFRAQMWDLYHALRSRTPREDAIAFYWADGPDTVSAPGHWNTIALHLAATNALSTAQTARMFAYLNAALHDAAVAVWDAKYHYWTLRPVTWIQQHVDPDFRTPLVAPPFPAYPSGHAGYSGAASAVLAHFLPEESAFVRALASEAALSRFYAGVHVRADNEVGLAMGERVGALAVAAAAADGGWRGSLSGPTAIRLYEPATTPRWAPPPSSR
ncbi:MAG TPA: phosphatase PAP2 family protein [Candidatus Thermoplasmatota archaeon]|nr:phosphatase PAP2 family protein [Candidatus Thermoplasmatota archaeon]